MMAPSLTPRLKQKLPLVVCCVEKGQFGGQIVQFDPLDTLMSSV